MNKLGSVLGSWKCGTPVHKIFECYWITRKYIYTSRSAIRFAQPTGVTHAHLLKPNEVTPAITSDMYRNRRQKLTEMICKSSRITQHSDTAYLLVLPSASVVYMSENIPYPFRQNTDFLYLCGFKEANSVLILHSVSGKSLPQHESCLFIPKPSPHSERWEGPQMDLDTMTKYFGIDKALYIDNLENFLQTFAKSNTKISVWYDYLSIPFQVIYQTMLDFQKEYNSKISLESPRAMLHRLRVVKSDCEVVLMRKACQIAAESMKEVMKISSPLIVESHLHAKMDYECRMRGAAHLSFPPVVAGGDRANIIHYAENNQIINDNELLMLDAGCEYHGYSSDLARTWPINGKFTDPQKEIYSLVLKVQEELIQLCKKKLPLDDMFKIMCEKLGNGLQTLGIISKNATKAELAEAAYTFCPHHVSHYLGMDVHDTSLISRGINLVSGMVITVEPGIYISRNNIKVPERYRGICVRIEDDILITDEDFEVLTLNCPKHIDEIENLLRNETSKI